jgi:hypothetical protein
MLGLFCQYLEVVRRYTDKCFQIPLLALEVDLLPSKSRSSIGGI